MNKPVPSKRKKKDRLQKHSMNASLIKPRRRKPGLLKSFRSRDRLEPKKFYRSLKRKASLKLDAKKSLTSKLRVRSLTMRASCLSTKACNVVRLRTLR